MEIPNMHQAVMPYLLLQNAAGFIDFTKSVFDAGVVMQKNHDQGNLIMHAEINISGSTIMFCDAPDEQRIATANLFVYVDDADKAYQRAVENGATTVIELSNQDYGRTCGVRDPTGNTWWITSVND